MKIAIVSAIWQRKALTRIFLNSVKRYWQDYGIPTMIAGSEGVQSREMVLDHGAGYVEVPNEPLSRKFNTAAVSAINNYKPDAIMILGSDDFVNDTLIRRYFIALEQENDVIGFRDCYYYDVKTKEPFYWGGWTAKQKRLGESVGMGRLLSRKVFERLGGILWPLGDKGLDWLMTQRIKKHRDLRHKVLSVNDDMYALVDVKGFESISSLGSYDLQPVDNGILNTIPEFSEIEKL